MIIIYRKKYQSQRLLISIIKITKQNIKISLSSESGMHAITKSITSLSQYKFSQIKLLPLYKDLTLIHRGNIRHYTYLKQHAKQLKQSKFYLYQRQPIDICLEILKRISVKNDGRKLLTYITQDHYQTVQCVPVQNTNKSQSRWENSVKQGKVNNQILLDFIKTHKLLILKSYLDLHPSQAYHKICSFLHTKKNPSHTKIYNYCHFSPNSLFLNTYILPYLKQLHSTYLVTNQLKLRKLDRIRNGTQQQIKVALDYWQKKYQIIDVYSSTAEQEQFKINFVLDNKLGQYVGLESLLEGYGEKSYYAVWKSQ